MPKRDSEEKNSSMDDDGIVRHYSREHRLSRASADVHWLAGQYNAKKPGLFGSLVATRSLRFVFFSVFLFLIAGGLLSFLSGRQDSGILDGQLYRVSAFRFGDSVYITVLRSAKSDTAFRGSARMTAYIDAENAGSMDFFVDSSEKEEFRMTIEAPGKGGRLSLKIEISGSDLELTTSIR